MVALSIIFQVVIAFIYSLFLEWFVHKYILHDLGKKRGSLFSFHFFEHHSQSRRNNFFDPAYSTFSLKIDSGSGKELVSLLGLWVLHLPILLVFPWAFLALTLCLVHYFIVHIASHKDPEWARKWLPWHYAHHMAPNQEANWGVRFDWADRLLGTRIYYVGTEREEKDRARRLKRMQQKMQ